MSQRPLRSTLALVLLLTFARSVTAAPVDFNRDIRPILAEQCLTCHGPDDQQRKAKLRLDVPTAARAVRTELLERISADDDRRMPPPKTGKRLTPRQIELLRLWVEQGLPWSEHWAFQTPRRPAVPVVRQATWVRSPIDSFILARLEKEGLTPAPEAERPTLLRRLSLDLLGLPPTPAEVAAFLTDQSPNAYEKVVERLLASPHFGERLALQWLDLARFGDSDGYHDDTPRLMWPYRDYVIQSFNRNKPFDQFTVEQLAGDLLPAATLEQKIATAFHRCGPTSSEGGADAQEYLAKYAVDRVNTTAQVWLGLTLNCAECHDHKYDPLTTREYYRLFAFFNQVPEEALYRGNDAPPVIAAPGPLQQARLQELADRQRQAETELRTLLDAADANRDAAQAAWEKELTAGATEEITFSPWQFLGPFPAQDGAPPYDHVYPPEKGIALDQTYENGKLRWQAKPELVDGKPHYLRGENCATYLYRTVTTPRRQVVTFWLGSDDYLKVWLNDRLVLTSTTIRATGPNQDRVTVVLDPGENRLLLKVVNLQGGYGFYFSHREKPKEDERERLAAIARKPAEQRSAAERTTLRHHFRSNASPRAIELQVRLAQLKLEQAEVERAVPRLRVMADLPQRRPTHLLVRGDFRTPGELVEPGVPAVLGALPRDVPANRLALARWLVRPEHPLTARVTVNRLWQLLFGQGLVRTSEDFGVRGEPPSHPELLDWLAVEFVESGWDVKHLLRLIVQSATYRQSSRQTPELRERDPENRLLARGPRFRLGAELIRDNYLAISGLLDRDRPIGGPSVKPYQPADLWREMAYGDSPDKAYRQDHGAALYRRGLYTFWKRSVHYPAFALFDAPNREVCVARRAVTNTPLQAFVLLNDVAAVEAARVFAERILRGGGLTLTSRLDYAFLCALARPPSDRERTVLTSLLERFRVKYAQQESAAAALVRAGEYRPADLPLVEHAAWTAVAQMILNLDETLTRE